jgi:valyl-tRNA synthetase
MPHDLPKAYDPTAIEDRWAEYWVRENLFAVHAPETTDAASGASDCLDGQSAANNASHCPCGQQAFTILLPPPNVTGRLHMGHMLNQTEMDILTRWRRMSGRRALWVPGTDHAGIATQMMVERQLAAEGSSRQQLGREAFVERVWEWKRHYGGAILDQMKRLGASVDWQREYFTMDDHLSVAVREAFVRLHEQGLIYRGAYIVNWCPRCQTAISDLEVVHEEQKGHLWEIRYPVLDSSGKDSGEFLTVATTRPETMLGDVAVAIHPADERYKHLHGKKLRLPLVAREIPIILDEWVSLDFGTGAVKVTPAHDPNDFALGERHHLPSINVMDDTGKINAEGGKYAGLDRYAARKAVLHDLQELALLGDIKDHTNNVGHCDRCKTVVEPRLSTQWFVAVNASPEHGGPSMAEIARKVVEPDADGKKAINFTPEMFEKTYLGWMDNIHDWCISRQLWWGHRIPAWHCSDCHKITVARIDPTACSHCGSAKIAQETDVLDTWFSSGLLPVSVFGWPKLPSMGAPGPLHLGTGEGSRADFDAFYPTSVLVTGFDILFFWVARMIMMGCWFAGDVPMADGSPRSLADSVPFREVYIHALVRDANREKMSKTKGNVLDPIEIVQQYGTDAVRFTLAAMASPGTDIAFNVARTEGYRAFANKIWNAARFLFMNVDRAAEMGIFVDPATLGGMPIAGADDPLETRWIVAELHAAAAKVNQSLENYRYDDAANTIYQFFWGSFCDWYLEIVKLSLDFGAVSGVSGESGVGGVSTVSSGSELASQRAKIQAALTTLVSVFETSLRLLSPFMPFLTEEIWHALYDEQPPAKSIALTQFPQAVENPADAAAISGMELLQSLIVEVRTLRKEIGVEEKALTPIELRIEAAVQHIVEQNSAIVERMARVSEVRFVAAIAEGLSKHHTANFDVAVVYERTVDVAAERDRLSKDIAKFEKGLAAAERQLGNEGFLAKAPAQVVEGLKKQEAETRLLLEKAQAALAALPEQSF